MPEIEIVTHVATEADLEVSLISDLVMVDLGGSQILVSTTLYDGGFATWDTGGELAAQDSASYGGGAGLGLPVLATVDTETGPAVLVASGAGGALMLYPVAADGSLGTPTNLGQTSYGADLCHATCVTTAAGTQVLYAGLVGVPGIARITLDAAGRIVTESFTSDTGATAASGITALVHLNVGGNDFLISASGTENAITCWAINAGNGGLSPLETLGNETGLWISAPSAMAAAAAHGASYVILGAAGTSTLSVLRIDADGALTQTDHLFDDLGTRFGAVSALATVALDGRLYVIAGGGDDGITLFELMPNGRLLARATLADTTAIGLANISAIEASATGGQIDIFVASGAEAGLTQLVYTPPAAGQSLTAAAGGGALTGTAAADILTGGAGADLLDGGGGDDVLLDGAGADLLTGGAGADVFILSMDGAENRITDFQQGTDRIDLSGWSLLRDISQLTITQTSTGIRIAYLGEVLLVDSADGSAIEIAALTTEDLIDGYRILPDYTDAFTIAPDTPEPEPEPEPPPEPPEPVFGAPPPPPLPEAGDPVGTAAGETLHAAQSDSGVFARGGNDTLHGTEGDDRLYGEAGDDRLYGAGGNDLLDGGTGRDQMEGGAGNDTYYVDNDLDFVLGEISGGGKDTVMSWISYTLDSHLETLRLQGDIDIHATGNDQNNTLVGQAGDNVLTGLAGFDVLTGKAGADRLIGGPGCDWLVGDEGADVFVYAAAKDSRPGQDVRDLINGFEHGIDLIDLSSMDANTTIAGNQAFTWIGTDAFTEAGQLRFHTWGENYGIVEADQGGDGVADFQIFINLTDYMIASDFIL